MKYEKIIFIHIVKTGGTSIVEYFRNRLPDHSVASHGDFFQLERNPPLSPEFVANKQFISGHFGYDYIQPYLADSYSFTFLRDPLSRVLSFYKFCMHDDMQKRFRVARAAKELSLNGFLVSRLPDVCEIIDNQQTWQLASMYWHESRQRCDSSTALELAKSHLDTLSHVGFTESYDASFTRIVSDVGLEIPRKVPRQLRTVDPVLVEQIEPRVLDELRSRLELDYVLYDFARKRFPAPE